jgi:hypothetical protein
MNLEANSRQGAPSGFTEAEGTYRCWALIKRAIMTHDALPGHRKQSLVSQIEIIRDVWDGYDWEGERPPMVARFSPSPRDVTNMLPALAWLCWLKQQKPHGNRDYKLLKSRARNIPWWKLCQRFGRDKRTLERWRDGAIAAIYSNHDLEIWSMEVGK